MPEPQKDEKLPLQAAINQMGSLAGQIAGLTIILIFGAVFGGQWLDKLLGTGHVILISLVLMAGPLSLFLTFKLAMRTVKKLPQSTKVSGVQQKDKEEEAGE